MSDTWAKPKPPTEAEMAEWARLAEAAMPGPWRASRDPNDDHPDYWWVGVNGSASVATGFLGRDAAFVAASREAVPRLLAAVAERDHLIHIMATDALAYERGKADGRREERRAVCAQAVARAGPDEASPRRRVLVSFAKDVFADGVDDNLPCRPTRRGPRPRGWGRRTGG